MGRRVTTTGALGHGPWKRPWRFRSVTALIAANMQRNALLTAGYATTLLALVHVAAMLVGPAAFDYLDAPDLARLIEQGSWLPYAATTLVTAVLLGFAAYAFSGAGVLRPLPRVVPMLTIVGGIFTIRGLGVVWFVYLQLAADPRANPREIVFSLVALAVGVLFLAGRRAPRTT